MQTLIPRRNLLCGPISDHASSAKSSMSHLLTRRAVLAIPRRPKTLLAALSLAGCLALACSPSSDFRDGEVLGFHADTPPSTAGDVIVPAGPTDGDISDEPPAPETPIEEELLDDQTHDAIAPRTPDNKLLIPWMECSSPKLEVVDVWPDAEGAAPGVTLIDYCLHGLEYWAQVTDVAMVTTKPGGLNGTYEYLMDRKPANIRIVGGVSTYTLPGGTSDDTRPYDFADAAGWQFIAEEARYIASVTGINIVVLENETALRPWHLGEQSIDFNKLRQSLGALRSTGIRFMWYLPSVQTNNAAFPDRQQKSIEFLRALSEGLPDCGFIIGYIGYKDWILNRRTEVTRRQMMRDLLGPDRLLDYTFATVDGYIYSTDGVPRYCHNVSEGLQEISELPDAGWASVYPGARNWVTVARQFAEILSGPQKP